jgi:hypothetical protein
VLRVTSRSQLDSASGTFWLAAGLALLAQVSCSDGAGERQKWPGTGGSHAAGSSGGAGGSSGAGHSGAGVGGSASGGKGGASGGSSSSGAGNAGKSGSSSGSSGSGGGGSGGAGGKAGNGALGGAGNANAGSAGVGGAADAGEGSGTVGGSSSDCALLPICDDFESYSDGQTPNGIWSKQGGGSATVDTTRPRSGEQSVHIVTGESESGRVWLHTTTDRLFPTRHLFGRLWMYLDALPTTEVHWDMIEAQGTADEPEAWDDPFEIALRYGGQLDENFLANFETPGSYSGDGPSTDCAKFSETRMPAARWACMEWEFDSDNEVMRFWLDGEAIDDLEVHKEGTQCISDGTDGVWYYPTFESLKLGWREWWEAGSRELWIDDVAVGATRIGCE